MSKGPFTKQKKTAQPKLGGLVGNDSLSLHLQSNLLAHDLLVSVENEADLLTIVVRQSHALSIIGPADKQSLVLASGKKL